MNKKRVLEFSERARLYWIEKSHEVFKPSDLTEEEAKELNEKEWKEYEKK